ncbi:MAG: threonine--tRNA ligase [Candidatus Portnoybacteria bacterium]|nr:threonine--tRNA ligase [Candidatus Portnoybacteria bacterium]MDD4982926.1 threonine--tRNA ligase [Candidatus Portnoybacteria bacterium]
MSTKNESQLEILRHSAAHVLAAAVLEMFPEAKFAIGPNIEDGFYYDFDLPRTLIPEDLALLEEKMCAIIGQDLPFEKSEADAKEAIKLFKKAGQPYKVELIEDLAKNEGAENVSLYKSGPFVDLCRGPHIESAGKIKPDAFKLLKISGAYWRGSEKNKMLQRIYGTAWESKKDLAAYLNRLEEAAKRDHRKIGKDQDLFSFHDVAPGMPFFHPKGTVIYNLLKNFWVEAQKEFGYDNILCPSMLDVAIWKKSGHWDHYKDDMYFIKAGEDEKEYALRPMDCPGAILIYNNSLHSYRELPLRYAEPGLITRKEKSGQLNGLLRVQQFVQDDAHIFLTEGQIEQEVKNVINLVDKIYKPFGIKYKAYLSTRPDDYMGDIKSWEKAENALKNILDEVYGQDNYGLKEKDGAFYGPKIDYQLEDAIGRTWQCATIQLDFQMPEKFGCRYIDNEGKEQRPVMIHRTIMGAFERFMGILIEHYAGAWPAWLAPEQAWLLPIGEKHTDYANSVAQKLRAAGIRIAVKNESDTIGKKIRAGEQQKVSYLLVMGDKEIAADSVAVRERGKGDLGAMKVEDFVEKIKEEIDNKS